MLVHFRRTLPKTLDHRQGGTVSMAMSKSRKAWDGSEEPSLDEILDDPVMQQLMNRDRVEPAMLLNLVAEMRGRLSVNG